METKTKPELEVGCRVRFRALFSDVPPENWGDARTAAAVTLHDGETATVLSTILPDAEEKDHQYYNIRFEDGTEVDGVSGLHLELIPPPRKVEIITIEVDLAQASDKVAQALFDYLRTGTDADKEVDIIAGAVGDKDPDVKDQVNIKYDGQVINLWNGAFL